MPPAYDFEQLKELVPRLAQMEQRARAVADDGSGKFFCSNYLWLPMYTELRDVIGVQRRRADGEEREGTLFDGGAFQVAYEHLSRLLPPCRDCGCIVFAELQARVATEG